MVTDGIVRPIRFFSKALTGSQLNWSAREKECYCIYYGVRLFEELLDNKYFVLKTDHNRVYAKNVGSFKLEVSLKLPILEFPTCMRKLRNCTFWKLG